MVLPKRGVISKIYSYLPHKCRKNNHNRASTIPVLDDGQNNCKIIKVEVHSSSSGAGSDENLSSPDFCSETSDGQNAIENEYEDIYMVANAKTATVVKEQTEEVGNNAKRRGSRDSGSHSRSESTSSTNGHSNIIHVVSSPNSKSIDVVTHDDIVASAESGVSSASPSDIGNSEEEHEFSKIRSHHTLPHPQPNNSRLLKRVVSEPGAIYSPPPPPPLPPLNSASKVVNDKNIASGYVSNNHKALTTSNSATNIIVYGTDNNCHVGKPNTGNSNISNNGNVVNVDVSSGCKIDICVSSGGSHGSSVYSSSGGDSHDSSITFTNEESNTSSRSSPPSSDPQSSECSLSSPCERSMVIVTTSNVTCAGATVDESSCGVIIGVEQQSCSSPPSTSSSSVCYYSGSNEEPSATTNNNNNNSSSGETTAGGGGLPHLVNKQLVLPFIPPKFNNSDNDSNCLIKPSEYLKSIAAATTSVNGSSSFQQYGPIVIGANNRISKAKSELNLSATIDGNNNSFENKRASVIVPSSSIVAKDFRGSPKVQSSGPPPPPLPATAEDCNATALISDSASNVSRCSSASSSSASTNSTVKSQQPLSFISTRDLTSIQLRRTEKTVATKTMSAPYGPISMQQPFQTQKQDLIAELKLSKDITGIKKLKVERVKLEEKQEKEMVTEISRQFSLETFVEKIPSTDASGHPIPPWKRQMLAKKAAEKAKKEMEEQIVKEAEARRIQSIPAWKRQLLQSKKIDEKNVIVNGTTTASENLSESKTINVFNKTAADDNSTAVITVVTNGKISSSCRNEETNNNNKENNKPSLNNEKLKIDENPAVEKKSIVADDDNMEPKKEKCVQIIPWRAQLRKTNSKLNLLD